MCSRNPDGSTLYINRKLLAFRSTYFRKLSEKYEYKVKLDADTSTLALFAEWVYTDSVPVQKSTIGLMQLFDLFLLAQKLCTHHRLGDLVMDRIRQHCREEVVETSLRDVIRDYYEKVEAKSPLRRWLVKYVVWNIVNKKQDVTVYKQLIEEGGSFAMDLILILVDAASAFFLNPSFEHDYKYHKHTEGVECATRNPPREDRLDQR